MIENPILKDFDVRDIKTSKNDTLNHGFGLSSIRYIANKYAGDVEMSSDNLVFKLSIILKKA